jgi:hypothetical protein
MEEIECPSGYSYEYALRSNSYISFKNAREIVTCKFISTDDMSSLKLTPVARCEIGDSDLRIKAIFDHFLITCEIHNSSYCNFVRCRKTQKRVEIIRPDSWPAISYGEAVSTRNIDFKHCF